MHVNFAVDKKFEFSLKGIKEHFSTFTLNRFNMLAIASVILLFMILFGACQKIRLDSIQADVVKLNRDAMILKRQTNTAVVGVKNVSKGDIFSRFEKRADWALILKDITSSVPKNVYLQSLKSNNDRDKGLSIEIKGQSGDQSGVVDLATALGKTSSCSNNVKVQSSDSVPKADTSALNFTIVCGVKR